MDAPQSIYLDHEGNLMGITQKDLAASLVTRMQNADWYSDYSDDAEVRMRGNKQINAINADMRLLAHSNGGAMQAIQLWHRHAPNDIPASPRLFRAASLELQQMARGDQNPVITLVSSLQDRLNSKEGNSLIERHAKYRELQDDLHRLTEYWGQEIKAVRLFLSSTYGIDNPIPPFLKKHLQLLPMNEKTLDHAEGQVKRVGMLESFTPELKEAMLRGDAQIRHPFRKEYERELVNKEGKKETVKDAVNIEQYWKKSSTTDNYFLNKFDAELQKAGKDQTVKQTFYLSGKKGVKNAGDESENRQDNKQENKPQTRYTLKESYNLLSGRPVYKELTNSKGEEFKAWVQLDLRDKLPNGNHKMKMYNENYGFKLDDVVRLYPIKDLLNPDFKKRLMESLERGNLQKVTFVGKDKKQETVYISPSITNGSLNLYGEDGKRIPLETQAQKEWITKDFAKEQKVRFEQKNKQANAQDGSKLKQNFGQRVTKLFKRGA
ncbi:MAG: hypothetical protein J0I32_23485 [Sphingobacteriales bacterium]|nr:hypothetical protein [Sphingobacteriales bacterium]OJW02003.1 MAG: hypothetical protein BGO52_00540 [Sphingobacteriales bacterium 44-61]